MALQYKWNIGENVEREIDGLWFYAKIIDFNEQTGTYSVEYYEDNKIETNITPDELRVTKNVDINIKKKCDDNDFKKTALYKKESLLLQSTDYDLNKMPKIVIHNKGEITTDTGYIINGQENNIAAGIGVKGIRWLRYNTGDT